MAKEAKHIIVKPIYDEFSNMPYYISHEDKPILFLSEPLSREEKLFYLKHIVHCVNIHATLTTQRDDLLVACKNSPSQQFFADFALFAESCSQKPNLAVYQQRFTALATFLRSCEKRAENLESAIAQCKEKTDESTKTKTAM